MARCPAPVAAAALLALAFPSGAGAIPLYATDGAPNTLDRYETGAGGILTEVGTVSPTGPPSSLGRVGPLSNRSGVFLGGSDYFAFLGSANGALTEAGSVGNDALGLAVHPFLPVVYYLEGGVNLHWRKVQPDGTAFTFGGGEGGSVSPAAGTPIDVAVEALAGQAVYAAVDNTLYAYALNPDGSIAGGAPTTTVLPATADIRSLAAFPGGGHLYAAGGGFAAGTFALADAPLVAGGALNGTSTGFAPSTSTNAPNKLAVGPDGSDVYATTADGRIDRWQLNGTGTVTGAAAQVADNAGGTFVNGDGITVSPGGGSVYAAATTGGIAQYTRQLDGTLTAKSPRVVPGSAAGLAGDLAFRPLPVPFGVLAVTARAAGSATAFDASGSLDPDGLVNRFDWNFGDGVATANAGPTPTHVYSAPGVYTVTLTTIDNTGTPTTTVFTGHSAAFNGGPSSSTSQTVSIPAAPRPPATPAAPPAPVAKKTVVIREVSGSVLVKVPGSSRFVPIGQALSIPTGSQIDTRKGRVELTSAADSKGKSQTSQFYDGLFKVTYAQDKGRLITQAALTGKLGPCPKAKKAGASAKRRKRRLWGNGKGRFRTKGKRSSALVRGTTWLVEDRCDGTLTRVTKGSVTVRDFAKRKNVIVRKGKKYLARAKR